MKRKRLLIAGAIGLVIAVAIAIAIAAAIYLSPKWSELSFEAVVQETVTQPDGEVRLIVRRTTEIYANPLNALSISKSTLLFGKDGKEVSIESLHPENVVQVTLKNSFVEETPFYYPTVYEIRMLETN